MIQASELRLNNYVDYGGIKRVTGIMHPTLFLEDTNGYGREYFIEKCMPIPLTSAILERCGFVEFNGGYHLITGSFILDWDDVTGLYLQTEGQQLCLEHVAALHQLQNVFYALSGHELQITPRQE